MPKPSAIYAKLTTTLKLASTAPAGSWISSDLLMTAGRLFLKALHQQDRETIHQTLQTRHNERFTRIAHHVLWHIINYSPAGVIGDDVRYFRMVAIRCHFSTPLHGMPLIDIDQFQKRLHVLTGRDIYRTAFFSDFLYTRETINDCMAAFGIKNALIDLHMQQITPLDGLKPTMATQHSTERFIVGVFVCNREDVPSVANADLEFCETIMPLPKRTTDELAECFVPIAQLVELSEPYPLHYFNPPIQVHADPETPHRLGTVLPFRPRPVLRDAVPVKT